MLFCRLRGLCRGLRGWGLRDRGLAPTTSPPFPAEGRYLLINALANHLRYPNLHTHYFSCAILFLFTEAGSELVQEQITRVLLERLIVNRWAGAGGSGDGSGWRLL